MKWSDYCISAVRYDETHTRIVQVETREDKEFGIGSGYREPREVLIKNLKRGCRYITVLKDDRGNWSRGQRVRHVKVNGVDFITTADDGTQEADLLENLPELPAAPVASVAVA